MTEMLARFQAPPEGRRWWSWLVVGVCAVSIVIVTWMAAASILHAPPLTEGDDAPLPLYSPWLINTFLLADTAAACGLVLMGTMVFRAAMGEGPTQHRGLMLLMAGALVVGACASIGSLVIFGGDPYYWRLLVLRVLRGAMAVLTAAEWFLHPQAWIHRTA